MDAGSAIWLSIGRYVSFISSSVLQIDTAPLDLRPKSHPEFIIPKMLTKVTADDVDKADNVKTTSRSRPKGVKSRPTLWHQMVICKEKNIVYDVI